MAEDQGLSDFYGFTPQQFEFFSVHLVADISHAGAEMDSIRSLAADDDAVVAATESACDRLLAFLDGCWRRREWADGRPDYRQSEAFNTVCGSQRPWGGSRWVRT